MEMNMTTLTLEGGNEQGFEEEEWEWIEGWEGEYLISTHGRVWSARRAIDNGKGYHVRKGQFLAQHKTAAGERKVALNRACVAVGVSVAKVVAKTFVRRPKGCKYIYYRDGNTDNVRADNLVWGDSSGSKHPLRHVCHELDRDCHNTSPAQ